MLGGIYCYTVFISLVHDHVRDYLNRDQLGTASVSSRNHIVICEYTAFADELIQSIPEHPELADRDIVVITDLVGLKPYAHIQFVRGVPISPEALNRANIAEADYIFVFSNVRFTDPDLKTLHITSRIHRLNEKAQIFVELQAPEAAHQELLPRPVVPLATTDLLRAVIAGEGVKLSSHLEERPKPGDPVRNVESPQAKTS